MFTMVQDFPCGLSLELSGASPVVQAVQFGSAADSAGAQVGDHLLALNGVGVEWMAPESLIRTMEGKRPLSVRLLSSGPGGVFGAEGAQIQKPDQERISELLSWFVADAFLVDETQLAVTLQKEGSNGFKHEGANDGQHDYQLRFDSDGKDDRTKTNNSWDSSKITFSLNLPKPLAAEWTGLASC